MVVIMRRLNIGWYVQYVILLGRALYRLAWNKRHSITIMTTYLLHFRFAEIRVIYTWKIQKFRAYFLWVSLVQSMALSPFSIVLRKRFSCDFSILPHPTFMSH